MKLGAISNQFIDSTRPVLVELLDLKSTFRKMSEPTDDQSPLDEIMAMLAKIERKEHEVLIAWATSTKAINPTMLNEVKRGSCTYTLKKEAYLMRVLEVDDRRVVAGY